MKLSTGTWLTFVAGIAICIEIIILFAPTSSKLTDEINFDQPLPSQTQVQQWINYQAKVHGFDQQIKVDGVIGEESRDLWDKIMIDQIIIKIDAKSGFNREIKDK